jgi:cell division inhibitor SulA/protein ImuA
MQEPRLPLATGLNTVYKHSMAAALDEILQRHPVWRGGTLASAAPAVPSGFAELDRELPGGGWPAGALSEILCNREGIGELQLVLPALASLSWAGKRAVWLAPPHLPYAPALAAAGVDLAHLAMVRAPGRRDALWAAEQVLRAGSCHALIAWFPSARYEELRRLAVAAEASRAWVALFRPPEAAHSASAAALRLLLEPSLNGISVRIVKRRGTPAAAPLVIPVKRPVHALGRTSFPAPAAGHARGDRRLGLPVHA